MNLRPPTAADTEPCGRIIYEAFKGIADRRGFPPDFPSVESAVQLAGFLISHPSIFGVVAESDGPVIGSNFLDQRDPIRGVGPITVDPGSQERGTGRRLMQAALDRAQGAAGIRLLQDAHNTLSMSLYASLGFDTKEPIAFIRGRPKSPPSGGVEVRPMRAEDLEACAALCKSVHRYHRTGALQDALKFFSPLVVVRQDRITAYASVVAFWGHAVGETEQDLKDLLLGAAALSPEPIAFLLPTRQASLFRWCLAEGLKVVKPMTLMAIGDYQQPRGAWLPSVLY